LTISTAEKCEAGASQLVGLFGAVALGHQDEAMARAQLGQRLGNAGKQFDFLFGDGARETEDLLRSFFGDRLGTEALKAGDQRAGKAAEPVAVGQDGLALDGVEGLAHLGRGVIVVIQVADKGDDGTLEVDVVFP
jgi:hypothetical protein